METKATDNINLTSAIFPVFFLASDFFTEKDYFFQFNKIAFLSGIQKRKNSDAL